PARDLLVRLPRIPDELVDVELGDGRESFFTISEILPAGGGKKARPPRRIALAWDASGSRQSEATEQELAFLETLLGKWSDTAVDLIVFRDRAERPVHFPAGEGRARLFQALREAPVDGGTALSALDLRRAALPHQ